MRLASPASRDRIRFRIEPADLLSAITAPFIALALRDPLLLDPLGFPSDIPAPYRYAIISAGCAIAMILAFRLSDRMGQFFSARDAFALCAAAACAVVSSSALFFVAMRFEGVPRSTPLIFGLVLAAGMIAARMATRAFHKDLAHERDSAETEADLRRVIVVGVDRFASAAIKLTDYLRPRTTQIVAALDARPMLIGRKIAGVSIVGDPGHIGAVIDEYAVHGVDVDEVWLAEDVDFLHADLRAAVVAQCATRGVPIHSAAEALSFIASPPVAARELEALETFEAPAYFAAKRVIDICAATLLLLATFPLAICVAYVVFIDVGAPVFFWQQRIGKNGQKFLLYKFRTYRAPFNEKGRPVPEERRLSRVGRFIRASRLDEIPQLYNVLAGHMSLIGPRPLLPQDQPADPGPRLSVRPGVTGWAQINGGTIVTPEEKNALDLWYIKHACLRLDLDIVIGTLLVALAGEKLNGRAVEHAIRWYRQEFAAQAELRPATASEHEAPRDRRRSVVAERAERLPALDAVALDYPYRAVEPG
ncbi:sugar transferase [Methylosinus sp. LW4]|uniref:sugar transferase n=1 Tax=Methylosinus sp. LW4 TaxID=136993 RepID=UPI0003A0250A|nr:sugar transferase [Methylosinus sp. LW4]